MVDRSGSHPDCSKCNWDKVMRRWAHSPEYIRADRQAEQENKYVVIYGDINKPPGVQDQLTPDVVYSVSYKEDPYVER